MIVNIWELDELPFLKQIRYKLKKRDFQLLLNLRCLSYQNCQIMSKILLFQYEPKLTNTQKKKTLQFVVKTQKQIYYLKDFYQIMNNTFQNQNQFNIEVGKIKKFQQTCTNFVKKSVLEKCEVDFQNKQFITFGIYIQKLHPNSLNFPNQITVHSKKIQYIKKHNKFFIKCAINNFDFKPNMNTYKKDILKGPQPFEITRPELIQVIIKKYMDLSEFNLNYELDVLNKYVKTFDNFFYQFDEEHLKLQVFCNYPLLRFKQYVPIQFNDAITKQRLTGVIFSNSDKDCMFAHFIGYNADTIPQLEGSHCQNCRLFIEQLQQNPLLTNLRDNLCNPMKYDVFFCPEFNRFKLIFPKKNEVKNKTSQKMQEYIEEQQSEEPQTITQITYINYIHMRANLKKVSTKKRNKIYLGKRQEFPLSFDFNNNKFVIMDPARGRNCLHYQYTDLRMYYLNKVQLNTYKCPIKGCGQLVRDTDLFYLKQVEIVQKYLNYKTQKYSEHRHSGFLHIDHLMKRVHLQFNKYIIENEEVTNIISKQLIEFKQFYQTLVDPYVSFKQYTLGIPDKYQKKLKQKMMNFQNIEEEEEEYQYQDLNAREMGGNENIVEEEGEDDF